MDPTMDWCNSTLNVNRFVGAITDAKRIKMRGRRAVIFNFEHNAYLLTEDGDLFRYSTSEEMHRIRINHRKTSSNEPYAVFNFVIPTGYWSTAYREVSAKDLMWAAFGDKDLPAGHKVVTIDGFCDKIAISNLEIRRKK